MHKIKYHANGEIERLKVCLVIFGDHQVEGIGHNETFASVAKMVIVHAFLAVAAPKNWELHQIYFHNAFLHSDLNEEVYMKLPPHSICNTLAMVCRLKKYLYGLHQAPWC